MRTIALSLVIVCGLAASVSPAQEVVGTKPPPAPAATQPVTHRPLVQLAILLDTSGSMDGLIDQAKTQLWSVVNQFATAKHSGQRPELQVALYEYGKQTIPASEGYLRMILPLSTDLDAVSEQLFALRTNGGEEYCGRVIKAAADSLAWSAEPADLRLIVIAGNEPFTQGDLDYHDAVRAAVKRGVIVNTIHCGPRETGVQTKWEDGAKLGEGTYSFIDQGAAVVHIPAPQDEEITRLGTELNTTYIAYGDEGRALAARQSEQDQNAAKAAPAAATQRAVSKSGGLYRNARWDLVDAVKEKQVKLEELKDEQLPEAMRKMSKEERAKYVQEMEARRGGIQVRIQALDAERQKFVAEKMREQSGKDTTLGAALLTSLRAQAEKKGYEFEKKP